MGTDATDFRAYFRCLIFKRTDENGFFKIMHHPFIAFTTIFKCALIAFIACSEMNAINASYTKYVDP